MIDMLFLDSGSKVLVMLLFYSVTYIIKVVDRWPSIRQVVRGSVLLTARLLWSSGFKEVGTFVICLYFVGVFF